nr:PAS domain S-box protein [Spirochaetota bacterium]
MSHENIALAVMQGDPPRAVLVSRGLEIMSGYSSEELLSFRREEQLKFVKEGTFAPIVDLYYRRLTGESLPGDYEFVIIAKNGNEVAVRAFTYRIEYAGEPAVVVSMIDLTRMRNTERALRESRERYRLLFEHSPVGIFYYDLKMIIRECNSRFAEILRAPAEKLIGLDLGSLNDQSVVPCIMESLNGENGFYEGRYTTTTSGVNIAVTLKTGPVFEPDGTMSGGVGIIEDITKRYKAEEELEKSRRNFKEMIDRSPLPMVIIDGDDKFTYTNSACIELFSYTMEEVYDLTSWALKGFPDPEYRKHVIKDWYRDFQEASRMNRRLGPREYRVLCGDGTMRDIEFYMVPIGDMYFMIMNDMTYHRRAESEILKTRKIESLGILAGGIAHDFNNILTSILGNISLVKQDAMEYKSIYDVLEIIEKAALRAGDLTMQLLTFSKGGAPVKKITSIKTLLMETTGFVLSGSGVKAEFEVADDLRDSEIDEGQISQVIQNVVLNSRQAMKDSGVLKLKAENFNNSGSFFSLPHGEYIRIIIEDNGPGIPDDIITSIFDPFFTTKDSGSGLGLSVTYSIVKKHGGDIRVYSGKGVGTVFEILLPASVEKAEEPAQSPGHKKHAKARVLIMDDDQLILDLCKRMLSKMGFEPETSDNGEETIRFVRESLMLGNPFDCVIMDLTMPGDMGGMEVNAIIKELQPGVKTIVSSGYSDDPVMSSY